MRAYNAPWFIVLPEGLFVAIVGAFLESFKTAETLIMVECCFTSPETVGLLGAGAQDGHLDFHTAPEL